LSQSVSSQRSVCQRRRVDEPITLRSPPSLTRNKAPSLAFTSFGSPCSPKIRILSLRMYSFDPVLFVTIDPIGMRAASMSSRKVSNSSCSSIVVSMSGGVIYVAARARCEVPSNRCNPAKSCITLECYSYIPGYLKQPKPKVSWSCWALKIDRRKTTSASVILITLQLLTKSS